MVMLSRERRLYRITDERKIAGVAAGIADYLGVSVVLVRVAFIVSLFIGFGFPLYLLFWILTPRDPAEGYGRQNLLRILFFVAATLAVVVGTGVIIHLIGEPGIFLPFLMGLGAGLFFLFRGKGVGRERYQASGGRDFLEAENDDGGDSEARIAGVCARIADATGIDPVIVRVVTVILIPLTFPLVPILYAVAALVLPRSSGVVSR